MDLTTIKPETENGEFKVARAFANRARTVADTKRVLRTLASPILVLTSLPTGLKEVGHRPSPALRHPHRLSRTLIKFELPRRWRPVRHRCQSLPKEATLWTLLRLLEKVCLVTRTRSCSGSSLSASKNFQGNHRRHTSDTHGIALVCMARRTQENQSERCSRWSSMPCLLSFPPSITPDSRFRFAFRLMAVLPPSVQCVCHTFCVFESSFLLRGGEV